MKRLLYDWEALGFPNNKPKFLTMISRQCEKSSGIMSLSFFFLFFFVFYPETGFELLISLDKKLRVSELKF